jgi:hypothetical protein
MWIVLLSATDLWEVKNGKRLKKFLKSSALIPWDFLCRPLEGGTTEVKFSPKRNGKLDVGLITNQIGYFLLVVFEHASVNVGTTKASENKRRSVDGATEI